jgi:anthranilate phosphoribosyltransferase
MMIADLVRKAADRQDLSADEAQAAMSAIMDGEATPAQIAAFLVAMRMKGETVDEVTAFARVMRAHVLPVKTSRRPLVDTCGTGGDDIKTFNVSTAAAFVAAGAGVAIAKHGNRSVTSKCGSADVLEALGIRFDLPPDRVARCVDEVGIGFMFAPAYHPAMKHAAPVRRELGLRTVFNALGPLTNPAMADAQVLGVYRPEMTELHAGVLKNLGSRRAYVVHGVGGLDELSTLGETRVAELKNGEVRTYTIAPEDLGLRRARPEDLQGRTPEENARTLMAILEGEKDPARDIVVLNAAAAIAAGGKTETLAEAMPLAEESLDSGAALGKLHELRISAA